MRDCGCFYLAAGKHAEEPIFHQSSQSVRGAPLREQIVSMRLQDMQQVAVPGSYRQLYDALRQHPAVRGLRELDRASQDTMDLPQPQVPRMCKRHARRGKVAVRRPIQRSDDGQRDKLGKLPPRLVVPADRSQRQYCLTLVLRDLEVECFVWR